ncbi:MAG: carbohydrate ABC transporter substrate-binding protein [Firmicutes bacterium]|nr:carbohydrate ABC transporter substrate-binding protein [Bacillota bacterium]
MLLTLALCVTMLAACGSKKKDESAQTSASEQTPISTEKSEPAKANLRFMWWGSDSRHKATLEVIDQYQKANPGIRIDAEYGGYDGYFEKLTTQLSSGTAADIIQFDASMTTDLLRIGNVIIDVNTMTKYIDLSGFDQGFLNNFCVYNNILVGLPTGITAGAILVNTAVTKAAGIDISTIKTWDDLIEAGKKLRAHNPNQYFLNYELMTIGKEFIFTNLAQLTGKEIMNADYTLNFTRDDLYKVFDLIDRLYSSGTLQPAAESSPFDTAPWTNPKWISHDFAAGSLITSYINKNTYDFQDTADIIPQPTWEGAKESGVILRPAQLIGVASTCKTPEQAFIFLDYFFNDENAARILKDVRSIPPTEKARKICTDEKLLDPMAVKAVNLALPIATVHQNLSVPNDIVQIFKDAAAKIAFKQGTVEKITDETMKLLKDTLERLKD